MKELAQGKYSTNDDNDGGDGGDNGDGDDCDGGDGHEGAGTTNWGKVKDQCY